MAEIHIQRKSASAVWWVLGIIALIVVVWMLWAWAADDEVYGGVSRIERGLAPMPASTLVVGLRS